MATTLTAAYSAGADLFIAHVGHSRAYLYRQGALRLLTRDQTVETQRAHARRPVSVESRAQDGGHILTDAIGAPRGFPTIEVDRSPLENADCLLLCTNGLIDAVDEGRVADALAGRRKPDEQCATLVDLANQAGAEDNITVVLAQYSIPVEGEESVY